MNTVMFHDHGYEYQYLPPVAGDKRLLVLLHGTGGDENSLIELGRLMDPNAGILSPRGKSSEEGVNRFFRRHEEGVFDEEDLKEKAEDLADFIAHVTDHHYFEEVIAVGYSNGANIALAILLLHPEVLNGVLALRGMLPIHPSHLPDLSEKHVLLLSGKDDTIIPRSGVEALVELLEKGNAILHHEWLPTGHNLMRRDIEDAASWLAGRAATG